jgi:hypothetical protein
MNREVNRDDRDEEIEEQTTSDTHRNQTDPSTPPSGAFPPSQWLPFQFPFADKSHVWLLPLDDKVREHA